MYTFDFQIDDDGIAVVTMDMPGSANIMNLEFEHAMIELINKLKKQKSVSGVIMTSAKSSFFAGGDLHELQSSISQSANDLTLRFEKNKNLLRELEKLPIPVVAAINGAAIGGGWELCLACNYRIAVNSAQIGLPEVTLGMLPGAGGTVRSVYLLGAEQALPYLLEGKLFTAEKGSQIGLIDKVVTDNQQLVCEAKMFILDWHQTQTDQSACTQPWDLKERHKQTKLTPQMLIQQAMVSTCMLHKKVRGLLPAQQRILEIAFEVPNVSFDCALAIETEHLVALMKDPIAQNMITAFFFQLNKVKAGASRPPKPSKFKTSSIGVIGAGMMGQGIAYSCAKAGIKVTLHDTSLQKAQQGKLYSESLLDKLITKQRISQDNKVDHLERITPTDNLNDLHGCDLIIEAVFEKMELKQEIVKASEHHLDADGIWGSNTSTLPISMLASGSNKPENYIGIHFFSPVDKMPLVEIICGKKTSKTTIAKAFDFVKQIRKVPIIINDNVGFFTSRTFSQQIMEAAQMVAEGVHPIRVDNLGKAIGMPVGPLTVHDEVSQKLTFDILKTQIEMGLIDGSQHAQPEGNRLINRMVNELNRQGRYHGDGGYYDYHQDNKTINPLLLQQYFKPELQMSDLDIKDRLLFINVIETLKCLEEKVVTSVADANIGSIMGIGAPAWTGGYLQYVNSIGANKFIQRCDELANKYGVRFKAPKIAYKALSHPEILQ